MKKILSILFVLILCLGMFTACTGGDDDGADVEYPITVKIAHTDSSSRSTHVWAEWLGEYLEEKAPGHFNVQIVLRDSNLLTLQIGSVVINLVSGNQLSHSIVIHVNAIEINTFDGFVEKFKSSVFESTLYPIFIGRI